MGQITQIKEYVKALASVVDPPTIVAALKMYGQAVFFLNLEAAATKAIEKGIGVGGLFVQVEPLSSLGARIVISNNPLICLTM